jgi:DNA polymerase elongation subunit (family B)
LKETGWLLDVYVRNDSDKAILWFKTENGESLRLTDRYTPSLYIKTRNENLSNNELRGMLERATGVKSIEPVERKTRLGSHDPERLLKCDFENPRYFNLATKILQSHPLVEDLYNSDLIQVQLYLFTQFGIEPTRRMEIEYNSSQALQSCSIVEESEFEIRPPPFVALYFDIHPAAKTLTPVPERDPIQNIEILYGDEESQKEIVLTGKEEEIIEVFQETVREANPDFLFSPEIDNFALPYLKTRSEVRGLDLNLGREGAGTVPYRAKKLGLYMCPGRVALDYSNYGYSFDNNGWGIAGLVERSRFACLPPSISGRWTANRINDSRICFELIRRGYVIQRNRGAFEFIRPIEQIYERDKGSMIISPKIGLHYNVAALDFDSLFPNLIVSRNISFETLVPEGHLCSGDEEAILPFVTKDTLARRLYFKRLRKQFETGSSEWTWCEQRQAALKLVLVCIYGTSGCAWNRFGNVLAFEEINKEARSVMIRAKDHAQSSGFEVIYGDTDAVFVKKEGATREDYQELANEISKLVGLPMSLDHHFRFLMLLPLEGDPSGKMEAEKRYFALETNGNVFARGTPSRRHDTPKFIKEFERELIGTLFGCDSIDEVNKEGYEKATDLVTRGIDQVMTGELSAEDLTISKILRKPLNQYNSLFPHVTAALQLASKGKLLRPGDTVDFIFKDSDHINPLCRTVPFDSSDSQKTIPYDREKYRDLLLDAAEMILSNFGFSRDIYNYKRRESFDWLNQLYRERRKEALSEIESER